MLREAPQRLTWKAGSLSINLAARPCIMGILNVTPDSFSDGNRFYPVDKAVAHALEMEAEGADIIDIGGESTRPGAAPVDTEEELRRVIPVIESLAGRLRIPISIDTYKADVAEAALRSGAAIINDISGLSFDDRMPQIVADSNAGLVVMHTRGNPQIMQKDTSYVDIVAEVTAVLRRALARAEQAGISAERIAVDPGLGFGKSRDGNLELLRRLDEIAALGHPVLVGPSRKSFIGTVLERDTDERLFGTAAVVAISLARGASIFRVHDVKAMRDVADMAFAICGQ